MRGEKKFYIFFALPGLIYIFAVTLVPIILTLIYSFQKYFFTKPTDKIMWVGFSNYLKIFQSEYFWSSMQNTVIFLIVGVAIEFILGLIIALLFDAAFKKNNIATSLILLPSIAAPLVVGLIFRYMYNAEFGIASFVLNKLGLFNNISLLGNKNTALGAIISADIWQWTPFVAIILLSGLIGLPHEPFEAARIDGANYFGILRRITLPLLKPVIRIVILLRIVDVIKEFDKIFVMTYGGPGVASEVLNFTAYRVNYVNFDMGLGSAYVMLILIIIILISIFLVKVLKTEEF